MTDKKQRWGGRDPLTLTPEERSTFTRFGYQVLAPMTEANKLLVSQKFAEGMRPTAISKALGLPYSQVRNLETEGKRPQIIRELRESNVIPKKLDSLEKAMGQMLAVLKSMEHRMTHLEDQGRRMIRAAERRKMENHVLRQRNRDYKAELRDLKDLLWKRTGVRK